MFVSPVVPLILVMAPDMPRFRLYDHLQSWIVHPISEVFSLASRGAGTLWDNYIFLVNADIENEELKRQIANLESQLLNLEETQLENSRLKSLLNLVEKQDGEHVSAKIIGEDPSGETLGFFINAGLKQGVEERMPVISQNGVVGTIERSYPNTALFVALQDPSHVIDGIIQRSRAQFIVQGGGSDLTGYLKYLDRAADVRVGDLVLSSGLDQIFPKGLPVGYIIEVERPKAGVLQNAVLRPSVDLSYLEEVVVIKQRSEIKEQAR